MNFLEKGLTKLNVLQLTDKELKTVNGGDKLSEAVFYYLGVAFKYLEEASRRGAPPTGQQFR